jgi:hypothetical protein
MATPNSKPQKLSEKPTEAADISADLKTAINGSKKLKTITIKFKVGG